MKNEERLVLDGYLFSNDNDVKMAEEEKKKIVYLEEKLNYDNIESTKMVYEKLVNERVFRTPVGMEYVRKVRQSLMVRGVPEEALVPFRLYQTYSSDEDKRPVRIYKVEKKKDDNRGVLRASLWLNLALFLIAAGMIAIALLGETTNVLNYRYKLENDYAAWEQELNERENAIREKERELKLE